MIIGIVGSEAAKFTQATEAQAKQIIRSIVLQPDVTEVCSGECHLGGIDIWTHEICDKEGVPFKGFPPQTLHWESGFKPRNVQIAEYSGEVHNITLKVLPESFTGMRFDYCYHCNTKDHVKSGGCWTAKYAQKLGKKAFWHIIE